MRQRPTQIEFHVSHACNFTCESCSHFSQGGHRSRATVASFLDEVKPWAGKLFPRFLLMLGGEPTLNPELCDLLVEARNLWPEKGIEGVRILLVTNGWYLHRHPRLPEVLKAHDIRLDITKHSDAPEYNAKFDQIVRFVRDQWHIEPTFRDSYKVWTHIYRGNGKDVLPFNDGDKAASWRSCVSKECLQFFRGKLWKCPPLAYLRLQREKHPIDEQAWAPFLRYEPLEPDCSETELIEFLVRRDEEVCGQCPAWPERFIKPDPSKLSPLPMAYSEVP